MNNLGPGYFDSSSNSMKVTYAYPANKRLEGVTDGYTDSNSQSQSQDVVSDFQSVKPESGVKTHFSSTAGASSILKTLDCAESGFLNDTLYV
jgi:hypothetical protein